MIEKWMLPAAFAAMMLWLLRSAFKRGRVPTAHFFAKQFWAERATRPRLFWTFVCAYIFALIVALPAMIVARL